MVMKKKILAIGEIIWDVYPEKEVIGGAPLNFAAHASLCGAESALVSAVGNDKLGDDALKTLDGFGVSRKYVKRTSQPTGRCLVTLGSNAVPHYNVLRDAAYDNISVTESDIHAINAERYDALYFGTLVQRENVSRKAVHDIAENCVFGEVICDVNLRPGCYDAQSVRFCLEHATVLKVSIEEEPLLRGFGLYSLQSETPGAIARALVRGFSNLRVVIITLGRDGSYAYDARSGKEYMQGSVGDKVVSTVGAGDSFAAAWITCYLEGKPIEQCMKKAAELSGFVVAHTEAVPLYLL